MKLLRLLDAQMTVLLQHCSASRTDRLTQKNFMMISFVIKFQTITGIKNN